jgi:hypothetical protein
MSQDYVTLDKGWVELDDGTLRVQEYVMSTSGNAYEMRLVNGVYEPIPVGKKVT